MNNPSENIKNTVLEKIRQGNLRMKPRAYFSVQIILITVVAFLALATSVFVISFAFFSIHESGELFLFGFGLRGFLTFISLFPWFTLVIACMLVFLLEWLLRHFKFSYRVPILNTFFIILIFLFIVGLLVTLTPIHSVLLHRADIGGLPLLGGIYESVRVPHESQGEFRGVIVSIATSTMTITHNDHDADVDDGTRTVSIPAGFDMSQLHIGDRVYVAGSMASSTISSYGLHAF